MGQKKTNINGLNNNRSLVRGFKMILDYSRIFLAVTFAVCFGFMMFTEKRNVDVFGKAAIGSLGLLAATGFVQ